VYAQPDPNNPPKLLFYWATGQRKTLNKLGPTSLLSQIIVCTLWPVPWNLLGTLTELPNKVGGSSKAPLSSSKSVHHMKCILFVHVAFSLYQQCTNSVYFRRCMLFSYQYCILFWNKRRTFALKKQVTTPSVRLEMKR